MKSRVLSLPLVFAPLMAVAACAAPVESGGSTGTAENDLMRGGAFDPGGTVVVVTDYCAGATGSITASATSLAFGAPTTLTWSVNVPSGCTSPVILGGEVVAASGSKVVTPLANSGYSILLNGRTLSTASVNVTLPSTVHINGNTDEWRALLIQAVGTPNTRVVLDPNLELDMTGYLSITVREGVTLTSEKNAPLVLGDVSKVDLASATKFARVDFAGLPKVPARDARTLGPRIYSNSNQKPLFNVECSYPGYTWGDNVKFENFRLQGPHYDTMDGDDNLERGISIASCINVEVQNMELSGWSGASVYVEDPGGRQVQAGQVRIHDNFIHNNQHVGGNGYGVDVGAGAWVTIERNVFDLNRHAIAGSGRDGTSYFADHNLVLKGGGVHDKWYNHYTHLFDVHGDANCDYLPGDWFTHIWNCGNAGTYFEMTNNAFQYTNDDAIKLRGVPRDVAKIHGNVFAHGSVGDAIETFSDEHVEVSGNTAGVDPFGKYGVCDFDGDGTDDLFLATGKSWWFSSKGKMQWTFLSTNEDRLENLGLGDFDGDHKCDVLAVQSGTNALQLSKGGTGPWQTLPYAAPFNELRFGDFDGDHVADVFRRAPDGQWWSVSPGIHGWQALQSSSIPLSDLRFGDFDGDGAMDVMKRNGSGYQISFRGTSAWQQWSSNTDDFSNYLVADVDGFPGDDLVRFVVTGSSSGRWEVSSQGRNPFTTFANYTFSGSVYPFVGHFDGKAKSSLLAIDSTRMGQLANLGTPTFGPWGFWAH